MRTAECDRDARQSSARAEVENATQSEGKCVRTSNALNKMPGYECLFVSRGREIDSMVPAKKQRNIGCKFQHQSRRHLFHPCGFHGRVQQLGRGMSLFRLQVSLTPKSHSRLHMRHRLLHASGIPRRCRGRKGSKDRTGERALSERALRMPLDPHHEVGRRIEFDGFDHGIAR